MDHHCSEASGIAVLDSSEGQPKAEDRCKSDRQAYLDSLFKEYLLMSRCRGSEDSKELGDMPESRSTCDSGSRFWLIGVLCIFLAILTFEQASLTVTMPSIAEEYGWSGECQRFLQKFSLTGFVIGAIAGGLIGDAHGGKTAFFIGVFWWSFCVTLCPIGVALGGFKVFVALRLILSICAGLTLPGAVSLVGRSVHSNYRTSSMSLLLFGLLNGILLGWAAGPFFLGALDWRAAFYVSGLSGLLWLPPFLFLDPRTGRFKNRVSLSWSIESPGDADVTTVEALLFATCGQQENVPLAPTTLAAAEDALEQELIKSLAFYTTLDPKGTLRTAEDFSARCLRSRALLSKSNALCAVCPSLKFLTSLDTKQPVASGFDHTRRIESQAGPLFSFSRVPSQPHGHPRHVAPPFMPFHQQSDGLGPVVRRETEFSPDDLAHPVAMYAPTVVPRFWFHGQIGSSLKSKPLNSGAEVAHAPAFTNTCLFATAQPLAAVQEVPAGAAMASGGSNRIPLTRSRESYNPQRLSAAYTPTAIECDRSYWPSYPLGTSTAPEHPDPIHQNFDVAQVWAMGYAAAQLDIRRLQTALLVGHHRQITASTAAGSIISTRGISSHRPFSSGKDEAVVNLSGWECDAESAEGSSVSLDSKHSSKFLQWFHSWSKRPRVRDQNTSARKCRVCSLLRLRSRALLIWRGALTFLQKCRDCCKFILYLLSYRSVWALLFTHFVQSAALYNGLTSLPHLMELGTTPMPKIGFWATNHFIWVLPIAANAITTVFVGFLAEFLVHSQKWETGFVRKTFQTVAMVIGAGLLWAAAGLSKTIHEALAYTTSAFLMIALSAAGVHSNQFDLLPERAGLLYGLGFAAAALGCLLSGPVASSIMTLTGSFSVTYAAFSFNLLLAAVLWIWWSSTTVIDFTTESSP